MHLRFSVNCDNVSMFTCFYVSPSYARQIGLRSMSRCPDSLRTNGPTEHISMKSGGGNQTDELITFWAKLHQDKWTGYDRKCESTSGRC